MIGLFCFVLTVLAYPFKSKLRLEAENAVLRHQLDVDAPCARLREIEERRDVDARDCAAGRSGVVDGSVDASPV
jgi:hypothetical protein